MTFSSTKFRGSGLAATATKNFPYGGVVDSRVVFDMVFLQDYKSTFTANMPPRIGPWVNTPQLVDYVAQGMATAYPSSRLGLAHFSDYPTAPYGVPGEDFVYQEIVPLTPASEVNPLGWNSYEYTNAQHGGLGSVNGGDIGNCSLDATVQAAQSTTLGWSSTTKLMMVFTDQFPHDGILEPGAPHTNLAAARSVWGATGSAYPIYVIFNDDYAHNFQRYDTNYLTYVFPKSKVYSAPDYYNPTKIAEILIRDLWRSF